MSTKNVLDQAPRRERSPKKQYYNHRLAHVFYRALHIVDQIIATVTLIVLLGALGLEVSHMFTQGTGYFADVESMLHTMVTIIVGLEFIRMLIDTTPASILDVLTVAITRHVILTHDSPLSNMACIACIAGLFAIRRFLVPKEDLQEEMMEIE